MQNLEFRMKVGKLLIAVLAIQLSDAEKPCPQVSGDRQCACKSSQGVVDLTPLANLPRQGPRFKNILDRFNQSYSYNPCYGYSVTGTKCENANACQKTTTDWTAIADSSTEHMVERDNGSVYLQYTGPQGVMSTSVYLHCTTDNNTKVTTEGIIPGDYFSFRFDVYSCHVCPGGCKSPPPPPHHGVAVGIIGLVIMILLMVLLMVYCILGAVWKHVQYQVHGSDCIPNRQFWVSLPGLIMDGCRFTFDPCLKLIRRDKYERIDNQ